jgi:hypothetical protein
MGPGERRDPYREVLLFCDVADALRQQLAPVIMGPCFRRDDDNFEGVHPYVA